MKIMVMDESLPEWNSVPLHPETGKPWIERYEDLIRLSAQMQTQTGLDEQATRAKRDKLISDTKFRNEFYIAEMVKANRAPDAEDVGIKIPVYTCHPNTWERLPEPIRKTFKLYDPAQERGQMIELPDASKLDVKPPLDGHGLN